ncbi:MAG TPA: zf-HC2 domain-containing protein [Pyrinomonadaceae bacterium]|nr:zf-HC2 domain-containing protein [Pyrinomonadaceae bacterium]
MTEKFVGSECERAPDLVAFLYGEASPAEAKQFQTHIQTCASCRSDLVAFGGIRESLGSWRLEALGSSSVSSARSLNESPREELVKPSAVAAIREFFRLSPLWMKGAVAFASLLFCVLAALAIARISTGPSSPPLAEVENTPTVIDTVANKEPESKNTEEKSSEEKTLTANKPKVSRQATTSRTTVKPKRLQLTREEREELAADLRLSSSGEDLDLDLLGDGFNQD